MEEQSSFQSILLAQALRYPGWQAEDVYKLAYQAALGSEHMVSHRQQTQARLLAELAGLEGEFADALMEPLRADGSLVRVHLRPFARYSLPVDPLVEAFMRTAAEPMGGILLLQSMLAEATLAAWRGGIGIAPEEMETCVKKMSASGFPAIHHSDIYTQLYRPAYRVVAVKFLPKNWLSLA